MWLAFNQSVNKNRMTKHCVVITLKARNIWVNKSSKVPDPTGTKNKIKK